MSLTLTPEQLRVLGCLLEKSVTTPEQYPLTLNALVNACNQKSSRNPVMALEQGAVQRAANELETLHLVVKDENFRSRVEKYSQRFCGTPFSEYEFTAAEYAVVCLLILRGPQTPGELRSRAGRLYTFADNGEVRDTLVGLMEREAGALVARLPKQAGRQDHEYQHLFAGEVDSVAEDPVASVLTQAAPAAAGVASSISRTSPEPDNGRLQALEQRVAQLESDLARLRSQLGG